MNRTMIGNVNAREFARAAFVALDCVGSAVRDTFSAVLTLAVYDVCCAQYVPAIVWGCGVVLWFGLGAAVVIGAGAIARAFPDIENDD